MCEMPADRQRSGSTKDERSHRNVALPLPIRLRNKPHYCAGEPVPHVGEGVAGEQAEEFHQTAALECEAAPLSDEIWDLRMVTAIGIEATEVA